MRWSSFRQSIAWKKGCALISADPLAPSLSLGFRFSRRVRRSLAAEGTSLGKWRGSWRILRYISLVFSS